MSRCPFGYGNFPRMTRRTELDGLLASLENTIVRGPGEAASSLREQAARGELEGPLGVYARLIQTSAYRITDEMLAELRKSYSDDVLFELTVAASFGEAKRRHDVAISAIDAAWGES